MGSSDLEAIRKFQPTDEHHALVTALLESSPTCYEELSALVLTDPLAVAWVTTQAASKIKLGLGALYARLFKEAMRSKSASWAKLFLERFDPEFQKQDLAIRGDHNQIAVFSNWTTSELEAFVRNKRQNVLGEADDPTAPPT